MLHFKTILVPIDFSKESEYSLEWAIRVAAQENGARIVLVNTPVVTPVVEFPYYLIEQAADARERAEKRLVEWELRVPATVKVKRWVGDGEPLDEIVAACNKEHADLVVITTHGRTGLLRVVNPNFTEKVVRVAPCPVIVLHLSEGRELQGADHARS